MERTFQSSSTFLLLVATAIWTHSTSSLSWNTKLQWNLLFDRNSAAILNTCSWISVITQILTTLKDYIIYLHAVFSSTVKYSRNKANFLAQRLFNAMSGKKADTMTLQRLIINRCEIDLGDIKGEYEDMYKMTLASQVTVRWPICPKITPSSCFLIEYDYLLAGKGIEWSLQRRSPETHRMKITSNHKILLLPWLLQY